MIADHVIILFHVIMHYLQVLETAFAILAASGNPLFQMIIYYFSFQKTRCLPMPYLSDHTLFQMIFLLFAGLKTDCICVHFLGGQ